MPVTAGIVVNLPMSLAADHNIPTHPESLTISYPLQNYALEPPSKDVSVPAVQSFRVCSYPASGQSIQGIANSLKVMNGHMEIDFCGQNIAVTQERLNGPQVGAVVQKVGGKAVFEGVRRNMFIDSRAFCHSGNHSLDSAGIKLNIGLGAGEQPSFWLDLAGSVVIPKNPKKPLTKLDLTVLSSFSQSYMDEHFGAVDVGNLEVA